MPIENNSADDLQLIVPNLHRRCAERHGNQPDGGAETRQNVPRGMALSHAPDGIGADGACRSASHYGVGRAPLIVARAAQRRDDCRRVAARVRLAAEAGVHFRRRSDTMLAGTRWLIRRMDAVIATSAISASFLMRGATVVMHGVDTDAYASPADRAAAFAQSGLPRRSVIGRFAGCAQKRAIYLWRRCAGCCRAIPISPP